MKSYRFLPHTADIRLSVTGNTQEELFRSAFEGMAQIQSRDFCKSRHGSVKRENLIDIKSSDPTCLLIDFLCEVLALSHIHKSVYCDINFHTLTQNQLKATVRGYDIRQMDEDIKAVTYHEAEIVKNKNGELETVIVLDI